jgi:hypothetical protein
MAEIDTVNLTLGTPVELFAIEEIQYRRFQ